MLLERFKGTTALAQAQSWANLPADELKRRAAVAANERNTEELWNPTKAYLFQHGAKGSKVSPSTLRQYRGGLSALVDVLAYISVVRARQLAAPNARFLCPFRFALKWRMNSDVPTQDPDDAVADVKEKLHELEQATRRAAAAGVRVELDIRYDQMPDGGSTIPYVVAEFSRSM